VTWCLAAGDITDTGKVANIKGLPTKAHAVVGAYGCLYVYRCVLATSGLTRMAKPLLGVIGQVIPDLLTM